MSAEELAVHHTATGGKEDDDNPPALSSQALEALKEFLREQRSEAAEREEGDEQVGGEEKVKLVTEDWRLSQFWYNKETAETVAEEVKRISATAGSGPVACISCPTLYAYLKKMDPDMQAQLFEYDMRFKQYGSDFTFYNYNRPEDLPEILKHKFRVVVADPPYLSKECLEKVAQSISFLADPHDSYLLLLTGDVQKERAEELMNLRPCGFRPQHSNKLGNEFRIYTNYNPAGRLGGWEGAD